MPDWQIERLHPSHERAEFSCGKRQLDEFIHSVVSQYEKRKLGRTFVAVRPGEKKVYGYYTLAAGSVSFLHLPASAAKKLPKHPVPVALLGRLAVEQSAQGLGLGEELLMDALHPCLELSEKLGIFAVEVMAIDQDVRRFYLKYGFVPLEDNELHLYLPLTTIADKLGRNGREQ
jgi:GNAT superfamily N-acetyltransferase